MKDNMKEKDLTVDFFFGNEEINPFNAPQMCVVRRLSTVYMKECSCSLTEKNALRKEGFPVTSILPEMTDLSTGCRIRTSTDTSTWEDWF